jgi:hypothetical protein
MVNMKHLAVNLLAVAAMTACMDEPVRQIPVQDSLSNHVKSERQLTVVVDVRCDIGLSYANLWNATVRDVVNGQLSDRTLQLRVLSNPEGRLYAGRFRTIEEKSVKLRFRKLDEMPFGLEGFVATDGTVWQLVDVDAR